MPLMTLDADALPCLMPLMPESSLLFALLTPCHFSEFSISKCSFYSISTTRGEHCLNINTVITAAATQWPPPECPAFQ